MSDDRQSPTRGALLLQFLLGLIFLGLVPVVIFVNGMPGGWGLVEVVILPAVVGAWLSGNSLVRLIRGKRP